MKKSRLLGAVCIFVLTIIFPQLASSVVIYSEADQGDIEYLAPPTFTLGVGDNSVIGSSFILSSLAPYSADADTFGFIIPSGAQLTSILYEYQVTDLFGDLRVFGVSYAIYETDPHAPPQPTSPTANLC